MYVRPMQRPLFVFVFLPNTKRGQCIGLCVRTIDVDQFCNKISVYTRFDYLKATR